MLENMLLCFCILPHQLTDVKRLYLCSYRYCNNNNKVLYKAIDMYTHLQLLPCYSKQVGMISTSNIHCRHHRTDNSTLLLFSTYLFTYFIHHFCNCLWSCKVYHSFIHAAILQQFIQLYHNYCDVHKFIIVVMTTLELLGLYWSYIHP